MSTLSEQEEIVFAVDRSINHIASATIRIEREISLMQEYRTRLAADVVTGKLDVREAAAKLPDLFNEDALSAEAEGDLEVDDQGDANSLLDGEE